MSVLQGKCKECLRCQRLSDINFKGIYRCEYYIKGEKQWKENQKNVK